MDTHRIEAIYPLSPLQQGILFHTLAAPDSRMYFIQWTCRVRGRLDLDVLRQAWLRVFERQAVLRTAFLWERRNEPLQVVQRGVALPWRVEDWRGVPAAQQQADLKLFLEADR